MSRPAAREPAHPTPWTYLKVGAALGIVTGVEVGVFFIDALENAFVAIFLSLSAVKFALVALFYMHLKFDSRLFSGLFVGGLLVAAAILVTLIGVFQTFRGTPTPRVTLAAPLTLTPVPPEDIISLTPEETVTPGATVTVTPGVAEPEAQPSPGPGAQAQQGAQVFVAKGCVACHTIDGVAGAVGTIGPKLNGLAARAETRRPGLSAEEYVRESIENPTAFVVDGFQPVMPPLRGTMTDEEFEQVVDFLLTLK